MKFPIIGFVQQLVYSLSRVKSRAFDLLQIIHLEILLKIM